MSYPPPTLMKRKSRSSWARYAVLLFVVAVVLGTCTASRFMGSDKNVAPDPFATPEGQNDMQASAEPAADPAPAEPAPAMIENATTPAPDAAAATAQAETKPVEQAPAAPPPPPAAQPAPAAQPSAVSGDLRQANRWYYVASLGDGPGAIYSRTGGQWDFAFACALPARTIEFIAVNTGDPGSFDRQTMTVGSNKMTMNASYSSDGGGTISNKLPARDRFFDSLTDGATMEVHLTANRRQLLQIGPDVARVVRDCRGR